MTTPPNAVERPPQIDGGRTRRIEKRMRRRERCVGRIAVERERQAVRADGTYQRGAAHPHLADRERRRIRRPRSSSSTTEWGNARWSIVSM